MKTNIKLQIFQDFEYFYSRKILIRVNTNHTVRRRYSMSETLFNFYIDDFTKGRKVTSGIKTFSHTFVNTLLYADNLVIICKN